ncbi:MAG: hypothetical protein KDD35_12755 [Bdellovibrionales bacterium]|nr:hypothetical protein [Bdellovibrionales bacterium]
MVFLSVMKVIKGLKSLNSPLSRAVLTIGNFDGLHLCHRSIIDEVLK